jgi:AbrB family looped-hinge helix DNA binding protein
MIASRLHGQDVTLEKLPKMGVDFYLFLPYHHFVRKKEEQMKSAITSKFQTTIPKKVRESAKLSIHDTLEWKLEDGKITVYPVQKNFLQYQNYIKTGPGNIEDDLENAKTARVDKYR